MACPTVRLGCFGYDASLSLSLGPWVCWAEGPRAVALVASGDLCSMSAAGRLGARLVRLFSPPFPFGELRAGSQTVSSSSPPDTHSGQPEGWNRRLGGKRCGVVCGGDQHRSRSVTACGTPSFPQACTHGGLEAVRPSARQEPPPQGNTGCGCVSFGDSAKKPVLWHRGVIARLTTGPGPEGHGTRAVKILHTGRRSPDRLL
ncbi:hypothetical protein LZ31DRAFT_239720 [Colletotrichum somersetense]|nr:hypothetical protein LZ31DRAFT_239720 [Colletotrichum somersetense]